MRCVGFAWAVLWFCFVAGPAEADALLAWPGTWQVSRVPEVWDGDTEVVRERGVRLAADGSQALVMELTRSRLGRQGEVDVQRVILQMRKSLQIDFLRQGFQAACGKPREARLGGLEGVMLVCSISQNGNEVMRQVLQVALGERAAYSLTYAAPVARYRELAGEVEALKAGLQLR